MDGEHIFSAAIVLVMVCVAFPTNRKNTLAMNAGLDLLRGMSQRGNSHMGARYELLVHLRSTITTDPGIGSGLAPQGEDADETVSLLTYPRSGSSGAVEPQQQTNIPGSTPATSIAATATIPQPAEEEFGAQTMQSNLANGAIPAGRFPMDSEMGATGMHGHAAALSGFPLTMVDDVALEGMLYDVDMMTATSDLDFGLWEEGFANPDGDAGYMLTQWTQQGGMGM